MQEFCQVCVFFCVKTEQVPFFLGDFANEIAVGSPKFHFVLKAKSLASNAHVLGSQC